MFGFELYKALRRKEIWLFIIVALVLEVFFSSQNNQVIPKEVNVKIYKYYLDKVEGKYTDEKRDWIINERDKYQEYLDNKDMYAEQFAKNEINAQDYRVILDNIEDAHSRIGTLEYLIERSAYLEDLNKENGNAEYFFDLDANDYIENMGVDLFVILLITVIVVHIFTEDYQCGTDSMVNTSKYGRLNIFLSRLSCTIIISTILGLTFPIIELIVKMKMFDLGNLNADIRCLSSMRNSSLSLSIINYLVLSIFTRILAANILGIIIIGITQFIHKSMSCYVISIGIAYLPYLIFDKVSKYINVISLCKGFSTYTGFKRPQKIFDLHGMVIWLIVYLLLCCIIIGAKLFSLKEQKE